MRKITAKEAYFAGTNRCKDKIEELLSETYSHIYNSAGKGNQSILVLLYEKNLYPVNRLIDDLKENGFEVDTKILKNVPTEDGLCPFRVDLMISWANAGE